MIRLEPLTAAHQLEKFRSGNSAVDAYLIRDALREQNEERTRVFVVVDTEENSSRPVGYFALSLTGYYVPVLDENRTPQEEESFVNLVELTFLARDLTRRGQGLGDFLLVEALERVAQISRCAGGPGVILRTTKEGLALYERFDFLWINRSENYLFLPISDVRRIVTPDSNS